MAAAPPSSVPKSSLPPPPPPPPLSKLKTPPPKPQSPPAKSVLSPPAIPVPSPSDKPQSSPEEQQDSPAKPQASANEGAKPKKCSIDPVYKKYFKLKKMHMPIENLKMKMQNEGLDPSVIDQEEPVWDEEEPAQETAENESGRPPLAALLAAKLAPATLRPVSEKKESPLEGKLQPKPKQPPQPEPKPQTPAEPEDSYVPPVRAKYSPSVPLRQVYWSVVSGKWLKDTIWEKMPAPRKFNSAEIEDLFELKKQGPSMSLSAIGSAQAEEEHTSFVDAKRETNIGIGVRKLRYSGEEVKKILLNIDNFSLSPESLLVMCEILPKEEECIAIRAYKGDLDKLSLVNLFLYSVSEIPNCHERAHCLLFKSNFNEEIEKIRSDLANFQSDCRLVLENPHFFYLLGYVLDLGNYLNGSSTRGGACGFHLEILCQLERTKSNDNAVSLIEYYAIGCL